MEKLLNFLVYAGFVLVVALYFYYAFGKNTSGTVATYSVDGVNETHSDIVDELREQNALLKQTVKELQATNAELRRDRSQRG